MFLAYPDTNNWYMEETMKRCYAVVTASLVLMCTAFAQNHVMFSLSSPEDQENGWFGSAVDFVGDVDGDGIVDFAVGAPGEDHIPYPSCVDAGNIYIFSGATGMLSDTLVCPYLWSDSGTGFGKSFCSAGDVDGDGKDDILAGAPQAEGNFGWWDGRVVVFGGEDGEPIYEMISPNETWCGLFGVSVSRIGDINGDQYDDFAIGALWEFNSCGQVHVMSGQTGVHIRTLQSPQPEEDAQFGHSVAGIPDVNGNGSPDVIIGSPKYNTNGITDDGRAYVFDSVTGSVIHTLNSPNPDTAGYFGWVVNRAGDVNGDACDDVAVGAWGENPGSSPADCGRAYVFDGNTGLLLHTLVSPAEESDGWFGKSIAPAGDVNHDGYDDVIVGACRDDLNKGGAYVFSGLTGEILLTFHSPNGENDGRFGDGVAGGIDVDGDEDVELIIGASREDSDSPVTDAGRAYVFTTRFYLSGNIQGTDLILEWTACPGADAYWLYGIGDSMYFEPGIASPYEYRLQVLNQETHSVSLTQGLGDPDSNWNYIVIGVDAAEQEIRRSNRFGEHDYLLQILE